MIFSMVKFTCGELNIQAHLHANSYLGYPANQLLGVNFYDSRIQNSLKNLADRICTNGH